VSQYLRMLQSAVDPADIDTVTRLFADDVVPAFEGIAGCLGIELLMSVESNAGGLVEGAALSRWESREAMEQGMATRQASEAQVRIVQLLRQEPVVRIFEIRG
jgi:heme-degrading monooxygenase HmoA